MTITEIISGLKFTIEMILFDPSTGEKLTEPRNDMDKITLDACKGAIKALEQQSCEDCISREAVDEYITNLLSGYLYDEERTRLEDLTAYIWELPPVTPQQKIGHWILLDECLNSGYYCSECHKKVIKEGWSKTVKKVKYCPNCGARMAESEDKE